MVRSFVEGHSWHVSPLPLDPFGHPSGGHVASVENAERPGAKLKLGDLAMLRCSVHDRSDIKLSGLSASLIFLSTLTAFRVYQYR